MKTMGEHNLDDAIDYQIDNWLVIVQWGPRASGFFYISSIGFYIALSKFLVSMIFFANWLFFYKIIYWN